MAFRPQMYDNKLSLLSHKHNPDKFAGDVFDVDSMSTKHCCYKIKI